MFEEFEEPQDLWKAFELGNERERAESLSDLAEENFLKQDFATSVTCAQESEALYTKLDDSYGIAHARFLQGRSLRYAERYPEALELLTQAAEAFTPNARQNYRAWVLYERGICYGKLEQFRLAQFDFHNAGLLWAHEHMGGLAGKSFIDSGETLYEQGLYTEAEFEAGQALKHLEESDDFLPRSRALSLRSKALQKQGNFVQAIADNHDCANILKYLQNERLAAKVATDLAEIHLENQDPGQALTAIAAARALYLENPHVQGSAECDYLHAMVCYQSEEYEQSRAMAQSARSAFALTTNKHRTFNCEYLLAQLATSQDPLEGSRAFEHALAWAAKSGFVLESHEIYLGLAKCYLSLGRYEPALETIRKAQRPFMADQLADEARSIEARLLLLLDRPSEALQLLEVVKPQDWYSLETEARAKHALGDSAAAAAAMGAVLLGLTLAGEADAASRVAQHLADINQAMSLN